MGEGPGFWDGVRRLLWPAALGMLAGSLVFARFGAMGLWIAAGVLAAAALAANLFVVRTPPKNGEAANANREGGRSILPALAREIFESLPDPLMLLDTSGRVVFINEPMRAVVGHDAEKKHISSLLRTPSVLEAIDSTTRTGVPSAVEFTFAVPVERHYQAYVYRMGTNPMVTTLLLHDLTTMKRTEQMRVDFVANASHELRTPLAAVTGFIETLKGHAKDDPQAREQFLDIMSVEAGRMRRLIEDLLSLSRIELNEHVPPSGEVSLDSVVREAAAALMPLAKAERISIEVSSAPDLPHVVGDRDELTQLFQNLIHNAIKYGRLDGHVVVSVEPAGIQGGRRGESMVAVSVRDDGEGIPQDAIPRLTERFYRVDVKRSREKGGTGLGLAIVKHIVNRHHGRLQIESHVGEGSTFTVLLPAIRATTDAVVTELL